MHNFTYKLLIPSLFLCRVGNHMGYQKIEDLYPFTQPEHYHSDCPLNDYNNQHEVEHCRLAGLPDLDQSNSFVHSSLVKWAHQIVTMYEFDGLRVDTTHMVPKDFWKEFSESAGVFTIGEVFNDNPQYVSSYQGTALDSLLDYTMYYRLNNAFRFKQSMGNLHDGVEEKKIFPDATVLGAFLDNHDNHRFLSQNSDWTSLKNALAYIVFAEGIPIIYYGTEQGFTGAVDPDNRESLWPHYDTEHWLYAFISTIAKFRVKLGAAVYDAPQVERYVDDEFFAFSRGNVFVATTNTGSGGTLSRTITYHPYADGITLKNILDPSNPVTVEGGKFTVNIENGQPKVYYPIGLKEEDSGAGECVPDGERRDCGFTGVTQVECEGKGCCWSPKDGEPWCFHRSEVGFCTSETGCDV
jgi:alpha-amylase